MAMADRGGVVSQHDYLVERAGRWLKGSFGCSVVLLEQKALTSTGEQPDAIGWVSDRSILVECKSSRSDFLRDKHKWHRHYPGSVGGWRFYLTDPGVVNGECEIPDGWGVYEIRGRTVRHIFGAKYASAVKPPLRSDTSNEVALLLAHIRSSND